jgi:hypothetical protein
VILEHPVLLKTCCVLLHLYTDCDLYSLWKTELLKNNVSSEEKAKQLGEIGNVCELLVLFM